MRSLDNISWKNNFGKGQNTKNIRGLQGRFFQFLFYSASIIKNMHHTLDQCPFLDAPLMVLRQGWSTFSHVPKNLFPKFLFTIYKCITSQKLGS